MIEEIVRIIFLLTACISSGMLIAVRIAFSRKAHGDENNDAPPVTVIVSAHNEAENIPALFEHLIAQEYPRDAMTTLLIDDRSTDGTSETAQAFEERLHLRILRIDDTTERISPKKFALDKAIESATTEFLLFTDADCRPKPKWIREMVRAVSHADAVIGVAPLNGVPGFAGNYASYESTRTALLSIGAANLGYPYMATGRNWGYRKSLYEKSGGLRESFHHMSGDDDLLLQQFVRKNARIASVTSPDSIVESRAPATMHEMVRQKLRHLSASKAYRGAPAVLMGTFILMEWIALIVAPVSMFIAGTAVSTLVAFLLAKLTVDAAMIFSVHRILHHRSSARTFLSMMFFGWFHVVFNSVIGLISYGRKPRW